MNKGNNMNTAKNIMNSYDYDYEEDGANYDHDSETIIRII
jgi:hypothetical protein